MKVIQLNCWIGNLIHPLLDFIAEESPDILCAQEVMSTTEVSNPLFYSYQSFQHIQKAGNFKSAFFGPSWGAECFGQKIEMGNAIFSKRPLSDTKTIYINSQYKFPQQSADFKSNIRTLLTCEVDFGQTITIANHHGYHDLNPLGTAETIKSSWAVVKQLENTVNPLIFCSDLNIINTSPAYEPYTTLGLCDLASEHKIASTLSEVHEAINKAGVACDYIFSSRQIGVRSFSVSNRLVSDHKALIAEFDL